MSLPIHTAVALIKHFNLTLDLTLDLCLCHQLPANASSAYMIGYMGSDFYNAIQSAGGMAGEW